MNIVYSSKYRLDSLRAGLYRSEARVLGANLGLGTEDAGTVTYMDLLELSSVLRGVSSRSGLLSDREDVYLDFSGASEDAFEILGSLVDGVSDTLVWVKPVGLDLELDYESGALVDARSVGVVLPNANVLSFLRVLLGERNDMLSSFEKVTVSGTLTLLQDPEVSVQEVPTRVVYSLVNSDDPLEVEFLLSRGVFLAVGFTVPGMVVPLEASFSVLSRLGYLTPSVSSLSLSGDLLLDVQTFGYYANVLGLNSQVFAQGLCLGLPAGFVILTGLSIEKEEDWVLMDIDWVCEDCRKVAVLTFRTSSGAYTYSAGDVVIKVRDMSQLLCFDLELGVTLSASSLLGLKRGIC